jgi:hypothetical protein
MGYALKKQTPNQFDLLIEKIQSFQTLKTNWNGFGSECPNESSISSAISSIRILEHMAVVPIEVGPSAENGIGLAFSSGSKYGHIEFFNDGTACALVDNDGEDREVWEFDSSDTDRRESALRKICEYVNGRAT